MAWVGTILTFFVGSLLICRTQCDFPTDFLGNYVSDEEYNNMTFCWSTVCLKDSGRLIYDADHDSLGISPCDDFKTFALGNFYRHRVSNDRYSSLGLNSDVELQHFEKQKRILLKPEKLDDPKIFKIIKSFFRLCINSSETFYHNRHIF